MKKFTILLMLVIPCTAFAVLSDLNPPDWRTDPPPNSQTTFQGWSFSNPGNPAAPEQADNQFGASDVDISGGIWLQSYNGSEGVWRITQNGDFDIHIPNTSSNEPESRKEVWLQIIYADPAGSGFNIPIITNPLYYELTKISSQNISNNYLLDTYLIKFAPNPTEENIKILSIDSTMYVDEIVIDTICIPEPATIFILGLGSLIFIRKRN